MCKLELASCAKLYIPQTACYTHLVNDEEVAVQPGYDETQVELEMGGGGGGGGKWN